MSSRLLGAKWLQLAEGGLGTQPLHRKWGGLRTSGSAQQGVGPQDARLCMAWGEPQDFRLCMAGGRGGGSSGCLALQGGAGAAQDARLCPLPGGWLGPAWGSAHAVSCAKPRLQTQNRRIVTVSEPKLKTWEQAPPEGLSWVWTLGRIPSGAPFPGPGAVAWASGARLAPNLIK